MRSFLWKTFSTGLDDLMLGLDSQRMPRAFRSAAKSPPTLDELVARHEADPPQIQWPARFERRQQRIPITMPRAECETFADFHPARGPADTLIVYHHGLNEFPHDASASRVLTKGRLRERADWLAIRGAHHDDGKRSTFGRLLVSPESFADGLVSSVYAARAIATHLGPRYQHVVMVGMSMGGVISLLESATGSAFDMYVPLMSGPGLESLVYDSAFTRIVDRDYLRRSRAGGLAEQLDIASRLEGEGPPIRALLSSYDRLFHLEPQQAAYARVSRAQVTVISGGHISAAFRLGRIAQHIEQAIDEELWSPVVVAAA